MRGGYTKSTRLASYFKIIRFNYRALPDEYIFICLHIIRGRRVCVCVDIFKIGESSAVNNTQHTIERQKNVFFLSLKSNFRWKKSFFFIKKSNFFLKTNSKAKSLKTETNLSKLGEKKNNSIFLNVFLFMHKSPNRNKKPDTIEDEGEVI